MTDTGADALQSVGPNQLNGGLNTLGAAAAAAKIAAGEITSEALVGDCLARIDARDGDIHAWAFVDPELALAGARARDGEEPLGPLHGVPVGIKDVIDTKDMPTEYGSPLYKGNRPDQDTATVAALRDAGAVILGKTVTTEFACPFPSVTRNPLDLQRTPGVSSSGSAAAVADFMVPLANGTQTGGSVIRPASLCGLYGFKGSLDGLDRTGIRHLKPSIDTLGLMARHLEDIILMRAALTGEEASGVTIPADAPRIGIARTHVWPEAEPESVAMIERAGGLLARAGASVEDVELGGEFPAVMERFPYITSYESVRSADDFIADHLDQINSWSRQGHEFGQKVTIEEYEGAKAAAEQARALLAGVFDDYDIFITPSAKGEAPQDLTAIEGGAFNSLWTLLYAPCVTLPAFTGPNGMPVGLQVVGPQGQDARTIANAGWVERALLEQAGALPIGAGA
ncbi:MAG: amidase [Rhodospirillales bacterium]|nr:amidase [Rhodospirillales bacterium]MDP6646569.1 amidase [Rhodospirillales bacterium]MDP6840959.1 amidase [Rhodospirillales bacterium]